MSIAFEGEVAFFDYIADKAYNPADQAELHRVADEFRTLNSRIDLLRAQKLSHTDAIRFRAELCRALAEQFRSPECRKYLAELASTYDYLAESNATTDFLRSLDPSDLFQYDQKLEQLLSLEPAKPDRMCSCAKSGTWRHSAN